METLPGVSCVLLFLTAGHLLLDGCGGDKESARVLALANTNTGPTLAQDPAHGSVAELTKVVRDVRVRRASDIAWTPMARGSRLFPEDAVQTMEHSAAAIHFETTGGVAELGPLATMRIPAQPRELSRLKHISGRLSAVLQPGERMGRLEVELPPGTLVLERRKGSGETRVEAQLNVTPQRTSIAMMSGRATLRSKKAGTVNIRPEHFVELTNDEGDVVAQGLSGPPIRPLSPADEATVKTRGRLRFSWKPNPEVEGYRLAAFQRQTKVKHVDVKREASSARLELSSGLYTWTVRGLRGGEPLPSHPPRKLRVVVDRVPPPLALRSPAAGQVVSGRSVRVAGQTEIGARVEVDGRPIRVGADGSFSVDHPVQIGVSNIVVRATDEAGNARAIPRPVLRN